MVDLVTAYWEFWSTAIPYDGGYLTIYPEYTVPVNAPLPYLTYTITRNDMFVNGLDQVRIWTRSTNIRQLSELSGYLEQKIPRSGVSIIIPNNNGAIMLYRGDPFIQRQPMDEVDLQVAYINIIVNNYMP